MLLLDTNWLLLLFLLFRVVVAAAVDDVVGRVFLGALFSVGSRTLKKSLIEGNLVLNFLRLVMKEKLH